MTRGSFLRVRLWTARQAQGTVPTGSHSPVVFYKGLQIGSSLMRADASLMLILSATNNPINEIWIIKEIQSCFLLTPYPSPTADSAVSPRRQPPYRLAPPLNRCG